MENPNDKIIIGELDTDGNYPIMRNNKIVGWCPKHEKELLDKMEEVLEKIFWEEFLFRSSAIHIDNKGNMSNVEIIKEE